MTTTTTTGASRLPADLGEGAALLIGEIERYLAARARTQVPAPATAHPLVTRTTQALVDEALATTAAPAAPALKAPRLLGLLPERLLRRLRRTAPRPVSVAEHLELVALTVERYGWAHGELRTRSGRRCIAGAQTLLCHLGYGDDRTVSEAGKALDSLLARRGEAGPYYLWNDRPGRTRDQVLELLRTAASTAREVRR